MDLLLPATFVRLKDFFFSFSCIELKSLKIFFIFVPTALFYFILRCFFFFWNIKGNSIFSIILFDFILVIFIIPLKNKMWNKYFNDIYAFNYIYLKKQNYWNRQSNYDLLSVYLCIGYHNRKKKIISRAILFKYYCLGNKAIFTPIWAIDLQVNKYGGRA